MMNRSAISIALLVALAGTAYAEPNLRFRLHDASGREIRSDDYLGTPVFLEFGACW
jgi:hypothetical protein